MARPNELRWAAAVPCADWPTTRGRPPPRRLPAPAWSSAASSASGGWTPRRGIPSSSLRAVLSRAEATWAISSVESSWMRAERSPAATRSAKSVIRTSRRPIDWVAINASTIAISAATAVAFSRLLRTWRFASSIAESGYARRTTPPGTGVASYRNGTPRVWLDSVAEPNLAPAGLPQPPGGWRGSPSWSGSASESARTLPLLIDHRGTRAQRRRRPGERSRTRLVGGMRQYARPA